MQGWKISSNEKKNQDDITDKTQSRENLPAS
jgi:hypothetical protein